MEIPAVVMRMGPVDIIAINSSRPKIIGLLCTLVFFLMLWSHQAQSNEFSVGIVTKGSFILSDEPNVLRENKFVHGIVGYLPVGTRVFFSGQTTEINDLSEGQRDIYYHVLSSIGIRGMLREDLFQKINKNSLAVVVSSFNVALHNPNPKTDPDPANGKFKKLMSIGRYGGNYLEITADRDENFYDAILHRTNPGKNLPKSEKIRLWKELVRQKAVKVVEPGTFPANNIPVPRWSEQLAIHQSSMDELLDKVKDKLDDKLEKIRDVIGDPSNIQCLLKASGDAALGLKIFGTGLSFKLSIALQDQDQMFTFGKRTLYTGADRTDYTFLKNVKCDGASPERLHQFTIQKGMFSPNEREFVRLKDFSDKIKSEWVTSLTGKDAPLRMIQIKSGAGYAVALRKLDEFVSAGNSFIAKMPAEEKEVLLNLILREIAYFEHRDLKLNRDS